jgi:hypothetical protein
VLGREERSFDFRSLLDTFLLVPESIVYRH